MIKGRIVRSENDDLSAELLAGDEFWGELVIDEEDGGRMRLVIDPEAEIDFSFDYDEFAKVIGRTAERLWKMHQEQPERPVREADDEEEYEESDNADEGEETTAESNPADQEQESSKPGA